MHRVDAIAGHLTPCPAGGLSWQRAPTVGRPGSVPPPPPLGAPPHAAPATPSTGSVVLTNGVEMPLVGFGCVKTKDTMAAAFDAGYLHFDTARVYGKTEELPHGGQSELDLGGLLASSDSAPPFVTTKVASYGPNAYMWKAEEDATAGVIAEFEGCKERLGLSTVDCLILHWPGPPQEGRSTMDFGANTLTLQQHAEKRLAMWRGLEYIYEQGGARSIGVSNFSTAHLEALLPECRTRPMVNQFKCCTTHAQRELVDYCQARGIVCVAYSPIAGSDLDAPKLAKVGAAHGKSPAAVVLRWLLQRGLVVIPCSSRAERIASNRSEADGWELSAAEVEGLFMLDDPASTAAEAANYL